LLTAPHVSLGAFLTQIAALNRQFERLDENKDGVICFDEFRDGYLQSKGELSTPVTDEMLRREFDAADIDGTGAIKYSEYIAAQAANLVSSDAISVLTMGCFGHDSLAINAIT
jgi:hypothetical protein